VLQTIAQKSLLALVQRDLGIGSSSSTKGISTDIVWYLLAMTQLAIAYGIIPRTPSVAEIQYKTAFGMQPLLSMFLVNKY
jgi:hypothetical protein